MERLSRAELSAGAALITVLLCCFWNTRLILAFMLSAAIHESGHIFALALTGGEIKHIRADPRGLCILYRGGAGTAKNIITAAAGPLAGFVGAALCSFSGEVYGSRFLDIAAGAGVLLTGFNLLPIMPLDGGMILRYVLIYALGEDRGKRISGRISLVFCVLFLILGIYITVKGGGIAVLTAAIWLLLSQNEV